MLKQFAPNVVIPPSPKNTAWISNAIDTETIDAHGPSTTVTAPTPTACPVVPARQGKVEHHDDKTERAGDGQQRYQARVQQTLDARKGRVPRRVSRCRRAGRRSKH
jgi:hypothetical protein